MAEDWGLYLSLSLPSCDRHRPGKDQEKKNMIKKQMMKRRAAAAAGGSGDNDRCALALPTPSCTFNAGGGRSGDYDCCALVLPTPSCIFNAGGGRLTHINSLPRRPPMGNHSSASSDGGSSTTQSLDISNCPPSWIHMGQPFGWKEVTEAASGQSTALARCMEASTTMLDGEATVSKSSHHSPPPSRNIISTGDQIGGQLAPPQSGTWQEKAKLLNGTAPLRVLEKRLFSTDVSRDHARLLFTKDDQEGKPQPAPHPPQDQKRERGPWKLLDMLTEAEKEATRADGGLPLLLLDRWGNEHPGNRLKFWKSNHSYVILGKWPNFVRLGELESGDAVEVYVFRVPLQAEAAPPPTNAFAAGPSSSSAADAAASGPPPQGGQCMSWRLAVVVCSQVALEEEERRRRESPEEKEARRLQKEDPAKPRRKKPKSPMDEGSRN
ncbi:hypothetical protein Taro_046863 [Colocasia esculenta]|uniref:TF-B3 domain-containing protein n=1 Tax=Colocasia esculenta TaxID=4460 RepID=A0A843WZY3_COLES|nr:hypothetical protein [Colocasia esculenta]